MSDDVVTDCLRQLVASWQSSSSNKQHANNEMVLSHRMW